MEVKTPVRKQSASNGDGKHRFVAKRRQTTPSVYGRRDSSDVQPTHSGVKRLEREIKALREELDEFKVVVADKSGKTQTALYQEEKKFRDLQEDIKVKEDLLIAMKLNL